VKLSTQLSYAGGFEESAAQIATFEKAGLDLVWVAEAYGFDAVSLMGYLAAKTETVQIGAGILPIYSRTPTLIAQTAAGVDALSHGRCVLGLGASGPQVIEGWHGVPYDKPLARTREIVEICRKVWRREVLTHDGACYTLPLPPEQGTGLGKPLKLITHPVRADIPIFVASLGEKNVALTAEVAEGWLPLFFVPEKADDVWGAALKEGAAKRSPDLPPLEVCAGGMVAIGDGPDVAAVRDFARPMVALYVGGMGAKGQNFYNALARRYGFDKEAEEIQDLYLSGNPGSKEEAAAKVPAALLESMSLCGPEGYVRERIEAYKEAGVTMLNVTPVGADPVKVIEKLREWTA
jgi:F420-dependent oxidoreductase-like protein